MAKVLRRKLFDDNTLGYPRAIRVRIEYREVKRKSKSAWHLRSDSSAFRFKSFHVIINQNYRLPLEMQPY